MPLWRVPPTGCGRTTDIPLAAPETRQPVQVADLRAQQAYLDRDPFVVAGVEVGGIRTLVNVPMFNMP